MKNQRTLLIEQAARDDADEGTEWRDRMNDWLWDQYPAPMLSFSWMVDDETLQVTALQ